MKKICLFLFVIVFSTKGFSQLQPQKLNDSAMTIYKENPQKAIKILEQAMVASEKMNLQNELARSKTYLGIVTRDLGEFEKAKALSNEALLISTDSIINASAYNNIGACNRNLGLYEEALQAYIKALKIYESNGEEGNIATVVNNIGTIYSYLGMNDQAIENHLKAKDIFEKRDNKQGMSEVYNSIAIIYANSGKLNKALSYFKNSLELEEELNSQKGIAESTNNVGAVYYYLGKIDSALVYFNKSVKAEKSIGNEAGVGSTFNNIADVLMESNRLNEAKVYLDSAYYYNTQAKSANDISYTLNNYSTYYEIRNQPAKALEYYKEYDKFKDSISSIETKGKVAELKIQYETEKKEKEILSQRADIAEKELDLSKKNNYILGLSALAVVLILLGYLVYSQQKIKNNQLKRESQLKDALVKIETQNKLQDQRLQISRDLHDNIGAQLTFIISSLDNLKYGFKLPEKLNNKLKNISAFTTGTIYELRDTIWAMNKNEITLEDLQVRISNFIDKADNATDKVNFNFHIDNSLLNSFKFSSVEGMNIYRIIQEAINNAMKYANPSHIKVIIKELDRNLKIQIIDDGKGFNLNAIDFGNGINNMRKRAAEINAEFNLDSKLNKGTRITVKKSINT